AEIIANQKAKEKAEEEARAKAELEKQATSNVKYAKLQETVRSFAWPTHHDAGAKKTEWINSSRG
ncbi:MAG: hypothetical protein Q4F56_02725, partial [Candidatus Saccharibacteria bacterium]|nr:hypothetical protein [Candidatus Saccharibacteria bacterium]